MVGCLSFLLPCLFKHSSGNKMAVIGLTGSGKTKLAYFLQTNTVLDTHASSCVNTTSCQPAPGSTRSMTIIDVPSHLNSSSDLLAQHLTDATLVVLPLRPEVTASPELLSETAALLSRALPLLGPRARLYLGVNDATDPAETIAAVEEALGQLVHRRQQAGLRDSAGHEASGEVFLLPGQKYSFDAHAPVPVVYGRLAIPRHGGDDAVMDVATLMPHLPGARP